MRRLFPALGLVAALLFFLSPRAGGQDLAGGVDLLYPELAHPEKDAREAIKAGDLRFVTIDRFGKDAPGVNQYPDLKRDYGTKFVKQPFRIISTPSQNFSFRIRARAYAEVYNGVILDQVRKKKR